MILEYHGSKPKIHNGTYIDPDAVIRGDVTIGKGTSILFGAVISDEGGPVVIGDNCVIMEQAVIRGTAKNPVIIGNSVLTGPHAHLSGFKIDDEAFLATGSTIFNGAHVKRGCEVRINGVVHVNTVLEPETLVPIGWVAVGNPAQIFAPEAHDNIWRIQKEMDFPGTVFGSDRSAKQGDIIRKYAKSLLKHRDDKLWERSVNG